MSGHSKWNNIKNKKGAADAKKSKVFSQLSKQIRIAVQDGGSGDAQFNPSLRNYLDKARAANMPKEKIQKAIDRGLGKTSAGVSMHGIRYEAFGSSGEAYLIEAITDNPNRSASEVKFVLSRANCSLGSPGSAGYLFERDNQNEFTAKMPLKIDEAGQKHVRQVIDQLLELEDIESVYCSVELDNLESEE